MKGKRKNCPVCQAKRAENVRNRYATCGTRIDKEFDSFGVELFVMKVRELAEYFENVSDKNKFRSHATKEVFEDMANLYLTRQAKKFNEMKANEYALSSSLRKLVNRYAESKNPIGRIIAYLICIEYGTTEDDEAEEVNDDSVLDQNFDLFFESISESQLSELGKQELFANQNHIDWNALGFNQSEVEMIEYRGEKKNLDSIL